MATPLSQLVGTQAVLNVVTGKRYSMVPDEVVAYAVGHYGVPPAPIDPRRARPHHELETARRRSPPGRPSSRRWRSCASRHGTGTEDDLLILRR